MILTQNISEDEIFLIVYKTKLAAKLFQTSNKDNTVIGKFKSFWPQSLQRSL